MSSRLKPYLFPVLTLLAITFAIYGKSLGHEFLDNWDDQLYVTTNAAVRGLTWNNITAAFSNYYVGNYAPLHIISYMLDYELWGLKPSGFILSNILLHAANGIMFFFLLVRITGRTPVGMLGAFLFIVHPVQVESVAWVSQRKNLLCMCFFLGAFHLYLTAITRDRGRAVLYHVAALAAFILALLAKSIAVIFPLILVTYDFCYLDRSTWRRRLGNKLAYLTASGVIAAIAMVSQNLENSGGRVEYHGASPLVTLFTMLTAFTKYLTILLMPVNLSTIYALPFRHGFDGPVALGALLLLLAVALGYWLYRQQIRLFFWYVLIFIALAPVANIIPIVTLMNDRYLYFPMLGISALFAICLAPPATDGPLTIRSYRLTIVALFLLLPLPFISYRRAAVWQDSITLWTENKANIEEGGSGYDNNRHFASTTLADSYVQKANRLYDKGQRDTARMFYLTALNHDPDNYDALGMMGTIMLNGGQPFEARDFFLRLTGIYKRSAPGYRNLGLAYEATQEWEQAAGAFRHALEIEPDNAGFKKDLEGALQRRGNR